MTNTTQKILGALLGAVLIFVVLAAIAPAPEEENPNATQHRRIKM